MRFAVARLIGAALVLSSLTLVAPPATAAGAGHAVGLATAPASGWSARPEDYPDTVTEKDVEIRMSDGVVLRADVERPADASGAAIETPLPVLVTITAYNKTFIAAGGGGLAGSDPSYLVKRGYVNVIVDARGTGSSRGRWHAFGARENRDGGEVMEWAHVQPWSNGDTGMTGPSYMGISQLFAAVGETYRPQSDLPAGSRRRCLSRRRGLRRPVRRRLHPAVARPGDGHRSVPPALHRYRTAVRDRRARGPPRRGRHLHRLGAADLGALGGQPAYDGPFYAERSPINIIDDVDVPAFFIGGEHDLFQRGTPLLFENLRKRGIPTKMILGPWDHLQASSGKDVAKAGYGTLERAPAPLVRPLAQGRRRRCARLRHPEPQLLRPGTRRLADVIGLDHRPEGHVVPPVRLGHERQAGRAHQLLRPRTARRTSCPSRSRACALGRPTSGPRASSNQFGPPANPVSEGQRDQRQARRGVRDRARHRADHHAGPDQRPHLRLQQQWRGHAVGRGGGRRARRHGQQAHRRMAGPLASCPGRVAHPQDSTARSCSRTTRSREATQKKLARGEVAPIDVEVFPTAATIRPGHRLRLAVQAFDVPHLLPSAPAAPGHLTVIKLHTSEQYPSELTLPTLP